MSLLALTAWSRFRLEQSRRWIQYTHQRRRVLGNIVALAAGLGVSLIAVEGVLRYRGWAMPPSMAKALYYCYDNTQPNGITVRQTALQVDVMRPNFSTTCSFGDYRWAHDGDFQGFRNPESWSRT